LAPLLSGHEVKTAQEMGWGRLKNGTLIARAEEAGFNVFVSSDQNLKYQQNLKRLRLAVLILSTNFWPILRDRHALIGAAVQTIRPGQYIEVAL